MSRKNIDDGENSRERTSYSTHVWLHNHKSQRCNSLFSPNIIPKYSTYDTLYLGQYSWTTVLSFEIFPLDKIVDRQISDEDFQVFMGSQVATCVPDPHLSSYMIGERPANASSTTPSRLQTAIITMYHRVSRMNQSL